MTSAVTPHWQLGYNIVECWRQRIMECEDPQIDAESACSWIAETRDVLTKAGLTALEAHRVMQVLRDLLPIVTGGHPLCKQFIELLDLELECN